jgi:uncharacterized membrane protein
MTMKNKYQESYTLSSIRQRARNSLKGGNWWVAIAAYILISFFGVGQAGSINFDFDISELDAAVTPEFIEDIIVWWESFAFSNLIVIAIAFIGTIASMVSIARFIAGGVVEIGYSKFNLNMISGKRPNIKDIFSYFGKSFLAGFVMNLLRGVFVFLWSLLFIIPGIVASLSYAMAPYILSDNPDMTGPEALKLSKKLMKGHKAELFGLYLSFIGYAVLSVITCGIGFIWLNPYIQASKAAFYEIVIREENNDDGTNYTEEPVYIPGDEN